jgi:hypothetical protein
MRSGQGSSRARPARRSEIHHPHPGVRLRRYDPERATVEQAARSTSRSSVSRAFVARTRNTLAGLNATSSKRHPRPVRARSSSPPEQLPGRPSGCLGSTLQPASDSLRRRECDPLAPSHRTRGAARVRAGRRGGPPWLTSPLRLVTGVVTARRPSRRVRWPASSSASPPRRERSRRACRARSATPSAPF